MEVILHGDNVGAIIFGLTGALLTIVAKVCPYESASTSDLPYIAKQAVHSNESPVPEQIAFECERLGTDVMRSRARAFLALQNQRRSIRFMSQESFPLDILLSCIATGGCAPSGKYAYTLGYTCSIYVHTFFKNHGTGENLLLLFVACCCRVGVCCIFCV